MVVVVSIAVVGTLQFGGQGDPPKLSLQPVELFQLWRTFP